MRFLTWVTVCEINDLMSSAGDVVFAYSHGDEKDKNKATRDFLFQLDGASRLFIPFLDSTLAMILSVDDIVKADEILLRTEKLMHYGFQNVGRREIAEFIQSVQTYIAMEGKVTSKQLLARFYRDLSKDELKDVLMTLHARNLIELKPGDVEGEKITVITYAAKWSNLQDY